MEYLVAKAIEKIVISEVEMIGGAGGVGDP